MLGGEANPNPIIHFALSELNFVRDAAALRHMQHAAGVFQLAFLFFLAGGFGLAIARLLGGVLAVLTLMRMPWTYLGVTSRSWG